MQPLFTTVFADGQVQSIRPMASDMGGRWVAVSSQAHNWNIDPIHDVNKFKDSRWRNPLYSLWEGMNESPWTFITPFIVVPNAGNTILEAPTTPLSITVRVDPLAVTAPGSSAPSAADPTTVTAPPAPSITQNQQSTSSNTVFSSNTSLTAGTDVSSPSFGVQSYNLFNPNQPSQTPSTTQSQPSTPSSTVSSSFNSSMALEAPVSVLPPAIINSGFELEERTRIGHS